MEGARAWTCINEEMVRDLEARIEQLLEPFREARELLLTVPAISETASAAILAEIGPDPSRFPSAAHLLAWAGLCPANDRSAGKRRSHRSRDGNPWLKTLLVQCAWAAVRTRSSAANQLFQRLRARRGAKKAIVAVAAAHLRVIYFIPRRHEAFRNDPQPDLANLRAHRAARLAHQIQKLGCRVTLEEAAA